MEAGGAFEVGDNRVEGAVLVMRRAEEAQADVQLAGKPLHHGLSEARLANAWFAGDEHYLALARFRLLPPPHEQRHLLVAADQRRSRRTQRLEPTLHRGCTQGTRFSNPLEFYGAKIVKLEPFS